jgi:hypothetical protein
MKTKIIFAIFTFLICTTAFSQVRVTVEKSSIDQQLNKESLSEILPIYYLMLTDNIDLPHSVSLNGNIKDFYNKYRYLTEETGGPNSETKLYQECEEAKTAACGYTAKTITSMINIFGGSEVPKQQKFGQYQLPYILPYLTESDFKPADIDTGINIFSMAGKVYNSSDYNLATAKNVFVSLDWSIREARYILKGLTQPKKGDVQHEFLYELAQKLPHIQQLSKDLEVQIDRSEAIYNQMVEKMSKNANRLFQEAAPTYNVSLHPDSDLSEIKDFLQRSGLYEGKKNLFKNNLAESFPIYKIFNDYLQPNINRAVSEAPPALLSKNLPFSRGIFYPQGMAIDINGYLIRDLIFDYVPNYLGSFNGNCATWAFMASNLPSLFGDEYFWEETQDVLNQKFEKVSLDQLQFGDLVVWDLGLITSWQGSFRDFHIFMYLGLDVESSEPIVFTKNGRGFVNPTFMPLKDLENYYKKLAPQGITEKTAYRLR